MNKILTIYFFKKNTSPKETEYLKPVKSEKYD